jgi:hypothetical protein
MNQSAEFFFTSAAVMKRLEVFLKRQSFENYKGTGKEMTI